MSLEVLSLSFDLIRQLKPLIPRIRRCDRSLADQLVRSANSVALNIAEGAPSDPGTRRSRFLTAAGSANETLAGLRVAEAWGYVSESQIEAAEPLCRRVLAMLWKLTH